MGKTQLHEAAYTGKSAIVAVAYRQPLESTALERLWVHSSCVRILYGSSSQ